MNAVMKKHKRPLLYAIAGVIVLLLILVIGKVSADHAGKQYQQSLDSWQHTGKATLLAAAPTTDNPDAYPGRIDEQQQLDKQKQACNGYQKVIDALQVKSNRPPQLAGNPFGWLSSQYRQANNRNDRVVATAGTFTATAISTYQKLLAQCKWSYGAGNYGFSDFVKNRDANQALTIQNGTTRDGVTCHDPNGCLPNNEADLKEYARTYQAAYVDYDVRDANIYVTAKACAGTLTAAWCPLFQNYVKQYAAAASPWLQALETSSQSVLGSPDGDKIQAQHQTFIQKRQSLDDQLTAASQKVYPGITITDDTNGSDDIAKQLAAKLLGNLKPKSSALQAAHF